MARAMTVRVRATRGVAALIALVSARAALAQSPPPASSTGAAPTAPTATQPATPATPATTRSTTPSPAPTTRSTSPARQERVLAQDSDPDAPQQADEDEDSYGIFYIQALGGFSFANLAQFSDENFIPEAQKITGSGLFGGLGAGFRLYFITLGAQATLASHFGFELGTVGLDIGLHLPVPLIQPYARVGIGYAWMGDADYEDPAASQTDVYGLYVDVGLGLDIKLARIISLGAGLDAGFLNLGRQEISDAGTVGMVNLEESGDAIGLQIRAHVHLTLHI